MASQLYPSARQLFLTQQLSWLTGAYKAILLPESYIPDFDDVFLIDIFAGVRIATSLEFANKTAVNGVASCDAVEFGILADNRSAAKMIIFKDTAVEATSNLIAFVDTEDLQGTPVELQGFEVFFVPNALNGGIFRL